MKEDYLDNGAARSNLRYGYARRPEGWRGEILTRWGNGRGETVGC